MRKKHRKNEIWVLIVSGLILMIAVGGVFAYITAKTEPVKNEFQPVAVTCEIKETFDANIKKDVHVQNTGDVDAFIRAFVIANWISEDGQKKIYAQMPKAGIDYEIQWGTEGWHQGTDGFRYYNTAVAPQGVTKDLIETVIPLTEAPNGYRLQIQILASAFQANPERAVEEEWGITVDNGIITTNQ